MKRLLQKPFKLAFLVLGIVLFSWSNVKAQCNVGMTYSMGANGTVTFVATNAGTVNTQYFMWWFGNGSSSGSSTLSTAVNQYTANGTYTVNMFSYNVPTTYSCGTTQTIQITNVTTPTCGLNAGFTYTVGANGNVNFTNISTGTNGGTTYNWWFGNGSTSTSPNPSVTYTANGNYFVYFTASNSPTCMDSVAQMITVNNVVPTFTCNSSFTSTVGANGNVSFTGSNSGQPATNYFQWSWGDGTSSSSSTSNIGNHTYGSNGTYTVYLFTYNIPNTYSCTTMGVVTVTNAVPCSINASFTYTTGANGSVMFTNTSTGTNTNTTYYWSFGNGSTSSAQNPSTVYSSNGNFFVYFSASNGSCQDSTMVMINISNASPGGCSTNMTYTMGPNGSVGFTASNTGTTGTNYYQFNFGNSQSSASSSLTTANTTYSANGTYTVYLFSYNMSPTTYSCVAMQVVTVTNVGCSANSNFFLIKDVTQNFTWDAYPTFPGNIASATWYWGDGSSTTGLYPSHTYSAAGMYNICLSVSVTCGATQTTCVNSNIFKLASSAQMIFVNVKNSPVTAIPNQSAFVERLTLSPNPNNGSFLLNSPGEMHIEIVDALGRPVHQQTIDQGSNQLNLQHLSKGLYFVKQLDTKSAPIKMIIE